MSREDIFDAMLHWRLLRDAGIKIVTCQRGELDFSNLGGVITAIVDQYGAHDESVKLADRVISGKRLAISNGHRQAGALSGYDREILDEAGRVVRRVPFRESSHKPATWSARFVVSSDEETVATIRYMFEAVGDGLSAGSIARELNRRRNLALASREDVPGVSRLLREWREEQARLKERLSQANGGGMPSPCGRRSNGSPCDGRGEAMAATESRSGMA